MDLPPVVVQDCGINMKRIQRSMKAGDAGADAWSRRSFAGHGEDDFRGNDFVISGHGE
jgi:hypothetical protein